MSFKVVAIIRTIDDADTARRQADKLGRPGIEAKRGQTNQRIMRRGKVRLRFVNLALARKCCRLIRSNCGAGVVVKIYR
jgi:hypothetical protein